MTTEPTDFTEASLAEQIYAHDDEVVAKAPVATAPLPILLSVLKWNELLQRGGLAMERLRPEAGVLEFKPL
jgi:hypothetical protein